MKMLSSEDSRKKYLWLNQFENRANPLAHEMTTSKEILYIKGIDAVVTGIGTGGSYVGLKRGLLGSGIKVIGVQPRKGQKIQGLRNLNDSSYIPPIISGEADDGPLMEVEYNNVIWILEKMLEKYDILAGFSSGATAYLAYELAKRGKKVIAIFADTGLNYVSLYESSGIKACGYNFSRLYDPSSLPLL